MAYKHIFLETRFIVLKQTSSSPSMKQKCGMWWVVSWKSFPTEAFLYIAVTEIRLSLHFAFAITFCCFIVALID